MSYKIVFIKVDDENPLIRFPPLGLGSIIEYLKKNTNAFDIDVYDYAIVSDLKNLLIRKYKTEKPLLFCLSSLLRHYKKVYKLSSFLKTYFHDIPIIVGGPLVTSLREKVMNIKHIDYAIYGEGEVAFYEYLKYLFSNWTSIKSVPSLIYRDSQRVVVNPNDGAELDDFSIPMPDYESIHIEKYFKYQSYEMGGLGKYIPLMTSRGCPFSCTYCHRTFGRKIRYIEEDKIFNAIKQLTNKYKIKHIAILDDVFNINESRAKNIINGLLSIEPAFYLSFGNGFRADIISNDFIDFINNRRKNIKFISFGIESASPRIQSLIKKNLDIEKARVNIEKISMSEEIILSGNFMLGFPTEKREEIISTINLAKSLPLHIASFLRVTPNVNTEIFSTLPVDVQNNIIKDILNGELDTNFHTYTINLSELSDFEINILQRHAILSFYSSKRRVYRIIKSMPLAMIFKQGLFYLIRSISGRYKI